MMLVQEGDIGLDDPVSDYLPAFEDKQVIAEFQSGRQDLHDAGRPAARSRFGTCSRTRRASATRSRTRRSPRSSAPSPARAPRASRCCTIPARAGPTARARACSARSSRKSRGKALEEFLSERIFVPLGMSDTFYTVPAAKGRPRRDRASHDPRRPRRGAEPGRDHGARLRRRRPALDGRRLREVHPAVPEQRPRAERHAPLERGDGRAHGREPHRRHLRGAAAGRACRRSASRFRSARAATRSVSASRSRARHADAVRALAGQHELGRYLQHGVLDRSRARHRRRAC